MNTDPEILVVVAHPDDEVIFGWPVLQDPRVPVEILIASNHNAARPSLMRQGEVAMTLWRKESVRVRCLPYPAMFSEVRSTHGLCVDLLAAIEASAAPTIYTHNPLGEYGHPDHKLVHEVCVQSNKKWVLVSDMCLCRDLTPWRRPSERAKRTWCRNQLGSCILDLAWYDRLRAGYVANDCWTWNHEPVAECGLYYL